MALRTIRIEHLAAALLGVAFAAAPGPASAAVGSGTWDDQVVLETPPAPGEAAPVVSIVHDHHTNNGVLGAGYRLSASSVITRRSDKGGVPIFGDSSVESSFLLDGRSLVAFVGNDPLPHISLAGDLSDAVFQPEVHDGAVLTYDASTNTWTRRDDGWTWVYGSSEGIGDNASKIRNTYFDVDGAPLGAAVIVCVDSGLLCSTSEWHLAQIIDPNGNTAELDYAVRATPAALADTFEQTLTEQHLLDTISYAGAAVNFTYAERPDPRMDVSSGIPTILAHRLTKITSSVPTGELYSDYRFTYELFDGSTVRQSLLSTIVRESTVVGGGERVLRRVERQHGTPANGAIGLNSVVEWPDFGDEINDHDAPAETVPISVELNGDGATDLIVLAFGRGEFGLPKTDHRVYIATPTGQSKFINRDTATGADKTIIDNLELQLPEYFTLSFAERGFGYVIGDLNRDGWFDALVERDPPGAGTTEVVLLEYDPVTGDLLETIHANMPVCELRYAQLQDINGDGYMDLVRAAHVESEVGIGNHPACPARDLTKWVPNAKDRPYVSWDDRLTLSVPLEAETEEQPQEWRDLTQFGGPKACAVAVGEENEIFPRAAPFDELSELDPTINHARFADINQDGLADIAYALHACYWWDEQAITLVDGSTGTCPLWRPKAASLYSRIFYGKGDGTFIDSGLHAGPAVFTPEATWMEVEGVTSPTNDECVQSSIEHRLLAIDLDRDGNAELLRGECSYDSGDAPHCGSLTPYHGAYDRGLVDGYGATATGFATVDFQVSGGTALGDFDGNGFPDAIRFDHTPDSNHNRYVYLEQNLVDVAEGRVILSTDEHGGETALTWGYSASGEHDNSSLKANLEVLESESGARGAVTYRYANGAADTAGFLGFGLIEETNARGAMTEHAFYTERGRARLPSYRVDRRLDGTMEHVTVFVQGHRQSVGFTIRLDPPYDSVLLRQCDYEVGHGYGAANSQSVTLEELIEDCHGFSSGNGTALPYDVPGGPVDRVPPEWWRNPNQDPSPYCPSDPVFGKRPNDDSEPLCEPFTLESVPFTRAVASQLWDLVLNHGLRLPLFRGLPATDNDELAWPIPEGTPAPPAPSPPVQSGRLDTEVVGYITDYFHDHQLHQLDRIYDHRDTSTTDDDLETDVTWEQPVLDTQSYRLLQSVTSDLQGRTWASLERSNFDPSHFDRPQTVSRCGQNTGACRNVTLSWNADGSLATRTLPGGFSESWLYDWCGRPTSHTDQVGRVRAFDRDAYCRTTAESWLGATRTTVYDGHHRAVAVTADPGNGGETTATETFYQDAPVIVEDTTFVEPRAARLRGDGQLALEYRDAYGRTTRVEVCEADGVVTDINSAACLPGEEIVTGWWAYSNDGALLLTSAAYRPGVDAIATTQYTHDERGRVVVVQSPAHVDPAAGAAWETSTVTFGPGWSTITDPLLRATTTRATTLSRELEVDAISQRLETYNVYGQLVSAEGPGGEILDFTYDTYNQLASSGHRATINCWQGATFGVCDDITSYGYDALGRQTVTTFPDDTSTRVDLDGVGRPLNRYHEEGASSTRLKSWSYDDTSMPRTVTVTDEAGNTLERALDGFGRTLSEELTAPGMPSEVLATFTYGANGKVESATDAAGLLTVQEYDLFDHLVASTHPATGTTSFYRDGAGRVLESGDATGAVRARTHAYSGKPLTEHLGAWLVGQSIYDAAGRPTEVYRDGVWRSYTFDDFDRPTRIERGVDPATGIALAWEDRFYDAAHRLRSRAFGPVEGVDVTETWDRNAWGWMYVHNNANGDNSELEHDVMGRVRVAVDQEGYRSETQYDSRGRVIVADVPGGIPSQLTYSIDGGGLYRVNVRDGEGELTSTWHDGLGRQRRRVLPDLTSRSFEYESGRLAREVWHDAGGVAARVTRYGYDLATGRLAVKAGPAFPGEIPNDPTASCGSAFCLSYRYDSAGRVLAIEAPAETTDFVYDADGLLAAETYAGRTTTYLRTEDFPWVSETRLEALGGQRITTYPRDAAGRLFGVFTSEAGATESRIFSALNAYDQPGSTRLLIDGAEEIAHTFEYLPTGQVAARTTSQAGNVLGTTRWARYRNGVLSSIVTPSGQTTLYDYGAAFDHQLDRVHDGAGRENVFTAWNGRGQPLSIDLATGGSRSFTYDARGRTVGRVETDPAGSTTTWGATYGPTGLMESETHMAPDGIWTNGYAYDGAGRLVREEHGKSQTTYRYDLDRAGNRLRTSATSPAGISAIDMTYDGNTLLSVDGVFVDYSALGDVISDQHGYEYERSASGAIRAIIDNAAVARTEIQRDAAGLPVFTIEAVGGITESRVTHWDLDASNLPVEVVTGSGHTQTYVGGQGQLLERIDRDTLGAVQHDTIAHDLSGTVDQINGVSLGDATAFGDGLVMPANSDERFLFQRLETLPGAPKVHLARLRAYDPQTGRFLRPDPIGLKGGPHRNLYTSGDPVNYSDPMGLQQVIIDGAMMDLPPSTVAFFESVRAQPVNVGPINPLSSGIPGGGDLCGCFPQACGGASKLKDAETTSDSESGHHIDEYHYDDWTLFVATPATKRTGIGAVVANIVDGVRGALGAIGNALAGDGGPLPMDSLEAMTRELEAGALGSEDGAWFESGGARVPVLTNLRGLATSPQHRPDHVWVEPPPSYGAAHRIGGQQFANYADNGKEFQRQLSMVREPEPGAEAIATHLAENDLLTPAGDVANLYLGLEAGRDGKWRSAGHYTAAAIPGVGGAIGRTTRVEGIPVQRLKLASEDGQNVTRWGEVPMGLLLHPPGPGKGRGFTKWGHSRTDPSISDHFKSLLALMDELNVPVSEGNHKLITEGKRPVVDQKWLDAFPEEKGHIGETLTMHHVYGSPYVEPLSNFIIIDGKRYHKGSRHFTEGHGMGEGGRGNWRVDSASPSVVEAY